MARYLLCHPKLDNQNGWFESSDRVFVGRWHATSGVISKSPQASFVSSQPAATSHSSDKKDRSHIGFVLSTHKLTWKSSVSKSWCQIKFKIHANSGQNLTSAKNRDGLFQGGYLSFENSWYKCVCHPSCKSTCFPRCTHIVMIHVWIVNKVPITRAAPSWSLLPEDCKKLELPEVIAIESHMFCLPFQNGQRGPIEATLLQ